MLLAYVFGQGHRRVVMGLQHQGVQQVVDGILLPLLYVQLDLGHAGGIGGDRQLLLQRYILQHQNAGHDLCGAGHGKRAVLILAVQHPS